jgi:hypothetical protein
MGGITMSEPINDGGSAFPYKRQIRCNGEVIDYVMESGLSIRDYFAAAALQGLLGNSEFHVETDVESEIPNAIAKYSYEAADAMIKAREVK